MQKKEKDERLLASKQTAGWVRASNQPAWEISPYIFGNRGPYPGLPPRAIAGPGRPKTNLEQKVRLSIRKM